MNRIISTISSCLGVLLVMVISVATEAGQVTFALSDRPLGDVAGRGVAVADFDGDGALDAFVVAHVTWEACESRLYVGDGRGHFTDSGQRLGAARPSDRPIVFDVDGNGTSDVIVGRATWVNDGRGRFTPGPSVFVDADGAPLRGATLGDLNGDGAVDLVTTVMLGEARTNAIRLYLNSGKGKFHEGGEVRLPGISSAIAIGDLNGDRIPDVVVSGWRNEPTDACPNRVLLNDGKAHLTDTGQQLDEKMNHSHSLALGDVDGDKDLDVVLVAQGEAPSGGIYLNDGKGRFTPGSRIGAGGIEKVRLADFDGDHDLDIFLACIGPDQVWVNDGRGGFTDAGMRLGTDWSWELAVGDFNGERLPDVFVASFGMNRAAPPDQQVVARPLEVWLNTSSRAGAATLQSLAGHYEAVFTSTKGEEKAAGDLHLVNGKLTGTLASADEQLDIRGATLTGDRVVLAVEMGGVSGTISGRVNQGRIDGEWALMGDTGKCVLLRTGDAVGAPGASPAPARPTSFVHARLDVAVADFPAQGLILDIGGGGEGVIAQLKGQQVVAIDLSRRELDEAPGKPLLKVVMDARDLKFTDGSFPTATVFFTFMYIDPAEHEKVFREIHRVLQPAGRLLVWDPIFPASHDPAQEGILFPLTVKLPSKEIKTGYGVRFRDGQGLSHFVSLAERTGFTVVARRNEAGWFFLELAKNGTSG